MGEITRQPVFFVREKGGREGEGEEGVALKYTSYSHRSFFTRCAISYISYILQHKMSFECLHLRLRLLNYRKQVSGKSNYFYRLLRRVKCRKIGHDRLNSAPIGHEQNSVVGRKLVRELRR